MSCRWLALNSLTWAYGTVTLRMHSPTVHGYAIKRVASAALELTLMMKAIRTGD